MSEDLQALRARVIRLEAIVEALLEQPRRPRREKAPEAPPAPSLRALARRLSREA